MEMVAFIAVFSVRNHLLPRCLFGLTPVSLVVCSADLAILAFRVMFESARWAIKTGSFFVPILTTFDECIAAGCVMFLEMRA